VIRFRQGFGRLIRKKTDSGRVIVLDRRILKRSYGNSFLDSIPLCDILKGTAIEFAGEADRPGTI